MPEAQDFSWALLKLAEGKQVYRKGWNGKGMFVYLVPGGFVDYSKLTGAAREAADVRTVIEGGTMGSGRYICPHLDMMNAQGQIVVGWLASQTDMLATDWEVANG